MSFLPLTTPVSLSRCFLKDSEFWILFHFVQSIPATNGMIGRTRLPLTPPHLRLARRTITDNTGTSTVSLLGIIRGLPLTAKPSSISSMTASKSVISILAARWSPPTLGHQVTTPEAHPLTSPQRRWRQRRFEGCCCPRCGGGFGVSRRGFWLEALPGG